MHLKRQHNAQGRDRGRSRRSQSQQRAGLVCHNYRATEFQALILRSQLVARYNTNAAPIEALLAGNNAVRVQSRGRRSTQQNCYGFLTIWDGPAAADIPMERIHKAIQAEGFVSSPTYGPVSTHMLFNLAKSQFRLPEGGCPVTDGIAASRMSGFIHYWLGAEASTVDRIAEIYAKVAGNLDALRTVKD